MEVVEDLGEDLVWEDVEVGWRRREEGLGRERGEVGST